MKKKQKKPKFGNSFLAINLKHWTCSYCGKLLKDAKPFAIAYLDGNPHPYTLCTAFCMKLQVIKLEASHVDR